MTIVLHQEKSRNLMKRRSRRSERTESSIQGGVGLVIGVCLFLGVGVIAFSNRDGCHYLVGWVVGIGGCRPGVVGLVLPPRSGVVALVLAPMAGL